MPLCVAWTHKLCYQALVQMVEKHARGLSLSEPDCKTFTHWKAGTIYPVLGLLPPESPLKKLFLLSVKMSITSYSHALCHRYAPEDKPNENKGDLGELNDGDGLLDAPSHAHSSETCQQKETYRLMGEHSDKFLQHLPQLLDCLQPRPGQ